MKTIVGIRLVNAQGILSGKIYNFIAYDPLKVNDTVVVDTVNGFLIGSVVEVDKEKFEVAPTREVVTVVDLDPWIKRRENKAKKAELKKKMDKRVAELRESALYKMLAKEDETLAELLNEYEAL